MKRALSWYIIGCLVAPLVGGTQGCMPPPRYTIPKRSATSYWRNFEKEDVIAGIDLYFYDRMQDEVFRRDALRAASRLRFVTIELMVENGSRDWIEVAREEIVLSHSGEPPLRVHVIDFKVAQRHLRSLSQLWFGTGGTFPTVGWEPVIFFPFVTALLPQKYMWLRTWKRVLRDNRFEYGSIAPSAARHGFVYVELDELGAKRFFHDWDLHVAIRSSAGKTLEFAFRELHYRR